MIDISSWKEFKMTELFEVSTTKSISDKRGLDFDDSNEFDFVGRTSINNGIQGKIEKQNFEPNEANTFSVTQIGEKLCLFRDNRWYASQNIFILKPLYSEIIRARFYLTCVITKTLKVVFGEDAYSSYPTKDTLSNMMVKLPAKLVGDKYEPDWDYMESYMKAIVQDSEKSLETLRRNNFQKHLIDVSKWGEFRVGDLFEKLNLKCRKADFNKATDCSEIKNEEFSLPLTNAKHFNNGIQFYGRPDEWDSAEMTIDIVSNGAIAAGDVYAQPQKTGVLWDSYLVKCKYNIQSEFVLQYLACVIQKCVKQHFGWDDKCTWNKVKKELIKLPIDANGEPNWQYMEEYMKGVMEECDEVIEKLKG